MESKFSIGTQQLVRDTFARKGFLWGFIVNLVVIGIVFLALNFLPSEVPLFYSQPWGESRLAPKLMLFILPGLGILFWFVSVFMARVIGSEHKLLVKTLSLSSLTASCLLLYSVLGIVSSVL